MDETGDDISNGDPGENNQDNTGSLFSVNVTAGKPDVPPVCSCCNRLSTVLKFHFQFIQ